MHLAPPGPPGELLNQGRLACTMHQSSIGIMILYERHSDGLASEKTRSQPQSQILEGLAPFELYHIQEVFHSEV
jgi:hypothetical protein